MKLVVGLGNPGPRYAASRHNVGFRVVERLATTHGLAFDAQRFGGRCAEGFLAPGPDAPVDAVAEPLALLEPETFMNRSGEAVADALAGLPRMDPARDLVVVYDDLDLPLGRLRVRPSGGAGGHRGLESVIECLGTREFPRLRFGIGRPAPRTGEATEAGANDAGAAGEVAPRGRPVVDFVLDVFSPEEERVLAGRIPVAAEAVVCLLRDGVVAAMDRFNGAPWPGSEA